MELFESAHQIGEGTYGKVYRATNIKNAQLCAIKRIQIDSNHGFPFTTIREIRILKKLTHPNIVKLLDVTIKQNEMFISMEYLPFDLSGVIQNMKLHKESILSLAYQLIEAVAYIHSSFLVHRDIKSSNILIQRDGTLKLADFGLTRNLDIEMTNRVCTLWYRAPELLLGCTEYGIKVDSWSIGCVILEMGLGEIGYKGNDEIDQVHVVMNKLGLPKEQYKWSRMFDLDRYRKKDSWEVIMQKEYGDKMDKDVVLLCGEFLKLSPRERISPVNALRLCYMKVYKDKKVRIEIEDVHDFYCKERRKKQSAGMFE